MLQKITGHLLEVQTHKRVGERMGGRPSRNTETPDSNCARTENEILRPCHSLDWLTPSCMDELLETEGRVDHGDVG